MRLRSFRRVSRFAAAKNHTPRALVSSTEWPDAMKVPYYHLDAFTQTPFAGNPAAVCLPERALDEGTMQSIAAEKNLPATAFLAPGGAEFAAALVHARGRARALRSRDARDGARRAQRSATRSSERPVRDARRRGRRSARRRPARDRLSGDAGATGTRSASGCAGDRPTAGRTLGGRRRTRHGRPRRGRSGARSAPDIAAIAALPFSALIVTARGFDGDSDFVSRYFVPRHGIAEDFVTGSAHCVLAPYWAGALGKARLFARQLSSRGGEIWLEDCGARVTIAGRCAPFAEGTLTLP